MKLLLTSSGITNNSIEKELKTKVYIGVSAGSSILCPEIKNPLFDLYEESLDSYPTHGLNLVNFTFIPHLNILEFPNIKIDIIRNFAKEYEFKMRKKSYS